MLRGDWFCKWCRRGAWELSAIATGTMGSGQWAATQSVEVCGKTQGWQNGVAITQCWVIAILQGAGLS